MATIRKDDYYYTTVAAGQEVASEQVPADGKKWVIDLVEGEAPSDDYSYVALIWDYEGENEEIFFLTYGSKSSSLSFTVVGDGVKKLAIVLHNESAIGLAMGGSYGAREL